MTLTPASSHGGGGAANVSSATVIQTGNGSPVGVVTPTSAGALYQDFLDNTLYIARGATSATWAIAAGLASDAPGVSISNSGVVTIWATAAEAVFLSTLDAGVGTGNAFWWNYDGNPDGTQNAVVQLGSTGQFLTKFNSDGTMTLPIFGDEGTDAASVGQVSPLGTIVSGALPTATLASGTAAQLSTTRDVESHTPVTFNPGVATTATCTVALSPDNTTFSTLCVITKPVGTVFDGEIEDVVVRVPAGWYIKLTVNAQAALGTTTYY